MNAKRIVAIIILLVLPFYLSSDPITYEYEPYQEEEFPIWVHELRRAESIFFGSFVLTFPIAALCYNVAGSLGMPTFKEEYQNVLMQAAWAAGLSLLITGIDWIMGLVDD